MAANVQALLDHYYPLSKYRIKSKQQQQLATDAGVSWSSIQRVLDPKDGKGVDTIADIAVALHLPPAELLRANVLERIPASYVPVNPETDDLQRRGS